MKNLVYWIKTLQLKPKNEAKEQKGGPLSKFLRNFGASVLRNMAAGKGVIKAG